MMSIGEQVVCIVIKKIINNRLESVLNIIIGYDLSLFRVWLSYELAGPAALALVLKGLKNLI